MVWMGCGPSNCNLSYHLTVIRTFKKQPKLSKTGVRVKTLLYREETLLSRDTPLYWFKAPSPKLFCHEGPSTSVSFSTELLWLNVCFKKRFGGDVIYFYPKIVRDLDVLARWDSAQNEQWMWMTIFKNDKKGQKSNSDRKSRN